MVIHTTWRIPLLYALETVLWNQIPLNSSLLYQHLVLLRSTTGKVHTCRIKGGKVNVQLLNMKCRAGGQQEEKGFRRKVHILQGKTQQKNPLFKGKKLLGKPKGKDQLRDKRKRKLSSHIHTYTYIHMYIPAHMKQTHTYIWYIYTQCPTHFVNVGFWLELWQWRRGCLGLGSWLISDWCIIPSIVIMFPCLQPQR